jgi:integrase
VYGALRRDVEAKIEDAWERLKSEQPVKDARVTVAMEVEDVIRKAFAASGRRASTQANYATIARTHLKPAPFGALTLDKLRPSDVEALLVAKRKAGLSDSTVRLIYTVCRTVLNIAVRDGLVRRNVRCCCEAPHHQAKRSALSDAMEVEASPRGCGR